jgi:succinate-acetate transporter protein
VKGRIAMNWTMIIGGLLFIGLSIYAFLGLIRPSEWIKSDVIVFVVSLIFFLGGLYSIVKGIWPTVIGF